MRLTPCSVKTLSPAQIEAQSPRIGFDGSGWPGCVGLGEDCPCCWLGVEAPPCWGVEEVAI